jgi:hypothetical protein
MNMFIFSSIMWHEPTNREIQTLVTNRLVEFEKSLVQVQDFRQICNPLRWIYTTHLKINKRKATCKQLDLETLGIRPILPEISLDTGWHDLMSMWQILWRDVDKVHRFSQIVHWLLQIFLLWVFLRSAWLSKIELRSKDVKLSRY